MPDQTIVQLPSAAALDGTELLYAAQGGNDVKVTTAALRTMAQAGVIGQCRLVFSGGSIKLIPWNGNRITIAGAVQTIPDAGVGLPSSGLVTNTNYFVYAWMNGATMALEPSTTAYAVQTGTGVVTKNGDNTRTLVGYVKASAPTTYFTSASMVRSWFNEPPMFLQGNPATVTLTSPGYWYDLGSAVGFLAFAGEAWHLGCDAYVLSPTLGEAMQVGVALDSSVVRQFFLYQPQASYWCSGAVSTVTMPSEGYHYVGMFAQCSDTGGLTISGPQFRAFRIGR
jgi:hypothetical protein